MRVLTQAGK